MLRGILFFQEEDGIRDLPVTGVQTCALPIFSRSRTCLRAAWKSLRKITGLPSIPNPCPPRSLSIALISTIKPSRRSEERRVGKSVDLGGRRIIKKKKSMSLRFVKKGIECTVV